MANDKVKDSSINRLNNKKSARSQDTSPKFSQIVANEGLVNGIAKKPIDETLAVTKPQEKKELHSKEVESIETPPAKTSVVEIVSAEVTNSQSEKKEKARIGLVNQASTIKISKEAKKKFDAIRMATGAPSAYQLLELMMDAYYEQHLTPAQKQVVDVTSVI